MIKQKLADYLEQWLARNKRHQKDLATSAGIDPGTFSRWMIDNRFRPERWPSVARVVELTEDWNSIKNEFDVQEFVARKGRLAADLPELRDLYSEMKFGDLYAFHSLNMVPLEFRDNSLKKLIADGVGRGAFYLYVWILDDAVNLFAQTYRMQSLVSESEMRRGFEIFCEELEGFGASTKTVAEQVRSASVDRSPFMMHGQTLGGFWLSEPEPGTCWITQRLVTGESSAPARTLAWDAAFNDDFERFIATVYPTGVEMEPQVIAFHRGRRRFDERVVNAEASGRHKSPMPEAQVKRRTVRGANDDK